MGCTGPEEVGPNLAKLEGVKVKENWTKIEGEPGNRRAHTRVVATFDKVERLNDGDWFGDQEYSFKVEGKEFVYSYSVFSEGDSKEDKLELSGEETDFARAVFANIALKYTVVMPGRVTEANRTVSNDRRTVTWKFGFDPSADEKTYTLMKAKSRR